MPSRCLTKLADHSHKQYCILIASVFPVPMWCDSLLIFPMHLNLFYVTSHTGCQRRRGWRGQITQEITEWRQKKTKQWKSGNCKTQTILAKQFPSCLHFSFSPHKNALILLKHIQIQTPKSCKPLTRLFILFKEQEQNN